MVKFTINIMPCQKQGIYSITNNIDDRIYIGRTNNFYRRAYQHRNKFLNGDGNSKIRSFIKENPEACFEFNVILETKDIKAKEEEYIEKYQSVENGFNIIHNDDEIKDIVLRHPFIKQRRKKKKKKEKRIEKPKKIKEVADYIYLSLKKGYIRENGKLLYNPQKAKKLLAKYEYKPVIIQPEKTFKYKPKTQKKKQSKSYDWASVGLDILMKKSLERILSNETSNNG